MVSERIVLLFYRLPLSHSENLFTQIVRKPKIESGGTSSFPTSKLFRMKGDLSTEQVPLVGLND
jgi:hypothetical protein